MKKKLIKVALRPMLRLPLVAFAFKGIGTLGINYWACIGIYFLVFLLADAADTLGDET